LIGTTFTAALESELFSRGINVKRVKAPMAADERSIDYSRVEATTPYIIETSLLSAYYLRSQRFMPLVNSRVRVLDAANKQEVYSNMFAFAEKTGANETFVLIAPDP
jgi:hypothetical protein